MPLQSIVPPTAVSVPRRPPSPRPDPTMRPPSLVGRPEEDAERILFEAASGEVHAAGSLHVHMLAVLLTRLVQRHRVNNHLGAGVHRSRILEALLQRCDASGR